MAEKNAFQREVSKKSILKQRENAVSLHTIFYFVLQTDVFLLYRISSAFYREKFECGIFSPVQENYDQYILKYFIFKKQGGRTVSE